MNPDESALGRWWDVLDTTGRALDAPAIERQIDGRRSDRSESPGGAGSERTALQRVPTSPARPGVATPNDIAGGRRDDRGLPGAADSAAMPWWRGSRDPSATPRPAAAAAEPAPTRVAERLRELRQYLDHLREIRLRTRASDDIEQIPSLRNDVLFSRLMICQIAIDLAGALATQRGDHCGDDMRALRKLVGDQRVPPDVVGELERLLSFRNALMYGNVAPDTTAVRKALDGVEALERFVEIAHAIAASRR